MITTGAEPVTLGRFPLAPFQTVTVPVVNSVKVDVVVSMTMPFTVIGYHRVTRIAIAHTRTRVRIR